MDIILSNSSDKPIYEQISSQVKAQILSGALAAGAKIAQALLESEGIVVTRAANGNEVVDLYLSHPAGSFDAILMDIMMPDMDGYEATRVIRLSEKVDAADIPIIALTANAFAEDAKAAHDAGMNAHLSKPLDFNKLKNILARIKKNGSVVL